MKPFYELVKMKQQHLLSLSLAIGIILFLPDHVVKQIGLIGIRDAIKPYLGVILIFSISSIFVYWIISGFRLARNEYGRWKKGSEVRTYLEKLTKDEKIILHKYIEQQTCTSKLDANSGIVIGLVMKTIIFQTGQFGTPGMYNTLMIDFNINPLAWNYLNANSNLLGCTHGKPDCATNNRPLDGIG